jgi:hypothetical protein
MTVASALGALADEKLEPLTGRVVAVEVERDPARSRGHETSPHLLKVSYEYEVGGRVYAGNRYSMSEDHRRFYSRLEADERAAALLSERTLTLSRSRMSHVKSHRAARGSTMRLPRGQA